MKITGIYQIQSYGKDLSGENNPMYVKTPWNKGMNKKQMEKYIENEKN